MLMIGVFLTEGFKTAHADTKTDKPPSCDSLDAKLKMCSGDDVWLEKEESMVGDKKCMGKCGPKIIEPFIRRKILNRPLPVFKKLPRPSKWYWSI
jgi:hypothetical protein